MDDLENDIKNWIEEAYDGEEICKKLAAYLTNLGYTRTGLTEAQREAGR